MATINERKSKLENIISKIAGVKMELTIRGDREFTFSTTSVNESAANKVKTYFSNSAKSVEIIHDEECGTFVYVNA